MTGYALDTKLTNVCLTSLIAVESPTFIAAHRTLVSSHQTISLSVAICQRPRVETTSNQRTRIGLNQEFRPFRGQPWQGRDDFCVFNCLASPPSKTDAGRCCSTREMNPLVHQMTTARKRQSFCKLNTFYHMNQGRNPETVEKRNGDGPCTRACFMAQVSTFVMPQKHKRSILSRYEVVGPQAICLESRKVCACVRL